MKVCMCTDMEGVAGVLDWDQWCRPEGMYRTEGAELLCGEINAAVEGLFAGGADAVTVVLGHGVLKVDPRLLDRRVETATGPLSAPAGPLKDHDVLVFVGQHAKAGSDRAHMAHTGWFNHIDYRINGLSVGEFGQLVLMASEMNVRTVFATGDEAFEREAEALVPGIATAAVKRGLNRSRDDEADIDTMTYKARNLDAVHRHPETARQMIREAAEGALRSVDARTAADPDFGLVRLKPPYVREIAFRDNPPYHPPALSVSRQAGTIAEVINLPIVKKPLLSAVNPEDYFDELEL
ncbi:MAG: M55 family metallopeptidase [Planctomycetes bacterium]|nr:M55 family metallopeptidase [Planctomycetota bacterium]